MSIKPESVTQKNQHKILSGYNVQNDVNFKK